MTTLLVKFDAEGTAIDVQLKQGDRAKDGKLFEEGYQPATPPSWAKGEPWTGITRYPNGGVNFEYPPYVRRWDAFKDALINDPRSQQITQAALSTQALGASLPLFLAAIDSLASGWNQGRLTSLHRLWWAFKAELEKLTAAGMLEAGMSEGIQEIALTFDIELPSPPEEEEV